MSQPKAKAEPQHRRPWASLALSLLVLGLVAGLTLRFARIGELERLLVRADLWWLGAALLCKLLSPALTAWVYKTTLQVLGHRLRLRSFWLTAQVAAFVNGALPAGPLAMSALLLHVFRQRGIPAGVTTIAVALDTLTYQIVFYGMLAGSAGYLAATGGLWSQAISLAGFLAAASVLIGGCLWLRRHNRAELTGMLVWAQQALGRRLGRRWRAATVEQFLGDLYRGKDLFWARPLVFGRLLAYQAAVLWLDLFMLYCVFRALGSAPAWWVVMLGATLASFLTTLAPLPGGGGSFEATLIITTTRLGVPVEVAAGATLIYRVLTFWLPLVLTAATYRRLLRPAPHELAQEPEPMP